MIMIAAPTGATSFTTDRITAGSTEGEDGRSPSAGLVEGSDGSFYGTALEGGSGDGGVVFRLGGRRRSFRRGDRNDDGAVDVSEPNFSLVSLFLRTGTPCARTLANSIDDGTRYGGVDSETGGDVAPYVSDGGKRPTRISSPRSASRSNELSSRSSTVVRPSGVMPTIWSPSTVKCSDQRCVRG